MQTKSSAKVLAEPSTQIEPVQDLGLSKTVRLSPQAQSSRWVPGVSSWSSELPRHRTEDLMRRSRQIEETSAASSLIQQMRGLANGLPAPDRAFLNALQQRVRTGRLPRLLKPLTEGSGPQTGGRGDPVEQALLDWSKRMPRLAECSETAEENVHLSAEEFRHAKAASWAALHIARQQTELDPYIVVVSALLHEVGRPYLRALAGGLARPPRRSVLEQLVDGLHGPVGSVLLESWSLPFEVRLAVEHHHQPIPSIPRPVQSLCRAVQAADIAAHLSVGSSKAAGTMARRLEQHLNDLHMEPDLQMVEAIRVGLESWPLLGEDAPAMSA